MPLNKSQEKKACVVVGGKIGIFIPINSAYILSSQNLQLFIEYRPTAENLEDKDVDKRITLKWIFKR
jgi:hypothetical protein